jgi:hypothetical protein
VVTFVTLESFARAEIRDPSSNFHPSSFRLHPLSSYAGS